MFRLRAHRMGTPFERSRIVTGCSGKTRTVYIDTMAISEHLDPIVHVTAGAVQGRTTEGVKRFIGIPYAAPPVGALRFAPRVPAAWPGFKVAYRCGGATYRIDLRMGQGGEGPSIHLDGLLVEDGALPIRDDGAEHEVRVVYPAG